MKNKRIIVFVLILALALSLSSTALADEGVNPITAINNLTNMLYLFVTAIGVVFIILGGVQLAMALKEQDPSRKSHAILSLLGGFILIGIRFVVEMLLTGSGM